MQDSPSRVPDRSVRRRVLGAALAAGLAAALAPAMDTVRAADLPAVSIVVQADTATGAAPRDPGMEGGSAATPKATPAPLPAPEAGSPKDEGSGAEDADSDDDAAKDATANHHGIVIERGGRHIRIEALGRDRQYDSFQQFVQDAPWLAGLVFLSVLLVFLVPLLIIVLLIWYKMRKNRLTNETMLKLAERGVVSPAVAMDAVASGAAAAVAAAAAAPPPGNRPAYEHARLVHRRSVWSDLRKGVLLGAVGLGLMFWSILDDGTPNGFGLVLLFVGLGYCLLWYFEDRTGAPPRDTPGTPPPGSA